MKRRINTLNKYIGSHPTVEPAACHSRSINGNGDFGDISLNTEVTSDILNAALPEHTSATAPPKPRSGEDSKPSTATSDPTSFKTKCTDSKCTDFSSRKTRVSWRAVY